MRTVWRVDVMVRESVRAVTGGNYSLTNVSYPALATAPGPGSPGHPVHMMIHVCTK